MRRRIGMGSAFAHVIVVGLVLVTDEAVAGAISIGRVHALVAVVNCIGIEMQPRGNTPTVAAVIPIAERASLRMPASGISWRC